MVVLVRFAAADEGFDIPLPPFPGRRILLLRQILISPVAAQNSC